MAEEIKKDNAKEAVVTTAPVTPAADAANEQPKVLIPVSATTVTPAVEPQSIATSTVLSTPALSANAHPNDVQFNVTDPKKTSLQKGITVVSKETAEHFESLGLGKIVK